LKDLYSAFLNVQNNPNVTNSTISLIISDSLADFDISSSSGTGVDDFFRTLGERNFSLIIKSDEEKDIMKTKIYFRYPINIAIPKYLALYNIEMFFNISEGVLKEKNQGKLCYNLEVYIFSL
jgi:hypothetical protein